MSSGSIWRPCVCREDGRWSRSPEVPIRWRCSTFSTIPATSTGSSWSWRTSITASIPTARRAPAGSGPSAPGVLAAGAPPANQAPRTLRAWLRGDALPLLRPRLPLVEDALVGLGRQAARGRAAWKAVLDVLPGLDFRLERDGFSVAARPLSGYDSALGETVIMSAARRAGCRLGPTRVGRVLRLVE